MEFAVAYGTHRLDGYHRRALPNHNWSGDGGNRGGSRRGNHHDIGVSVQSL